MCDERKIMKKALSLLITLIMLSGCAESLALIGPASTSMTGGNLAQSAVSSVVSYGVKKQTGKSPMEHAIVYAEKHNPEKKKSNCAPKSILTPLLIGNRATRSPLVMFVFNFDQNFDVASPPLPHLFSEAKINFS